MPRDAPRLLVAAHAFPENGGARIDKFVKFLPRYGIEPIVLAAADSATPLARDIRAREYPASLEVHWARSLGGAPFTPRYLVRGRGARFYQLLRVLSLPERLVLVPDHMVRWIPRGIAVARRLARSGAIGCVLTSSPPESTHLIGYYLRRVWRIPWIADFRDLWTEKGLLFRPPTPIHARAMRRLERAFFRTADHVIANTPENEARHRQRFDLAPGRVTLIPNGFDPEDLAGVDTRAPGDGVFRIGYMGHFDKHGFPWREFLLAFAQFARTAGRIELVHCGFQSPEVRGFARELGIAALITWRGDLSHQDAVGAMARTDVLLSLLYENEYSDSIVNAKLYPYLMLHRPVLAIGPTRGAMARLVTETGAGVVVPGNGGSTPIVDALARLHAAWASGTDAVRRDERVIARYDLRRQTQTLAAVAQALMAARPAAGEPTTPEARECAGGRRH